MKYLHSISLGLSMLLISTPVLAEETAEGSGETTEDEEAPDLSDPDSGDEAEESSGSEDTPEESSASSPVSGDQTDGSTVDSEASSAEEGVGGSAEQPTVETAETVEGEPGNSAEAPASDTVEESVVELEDGVEPEQQAETPASEAEAKPLVPRPSALGAVSLSLQIQGRSIFLLDPGWGITGRTDVVQGFQPRLDIDLGIPVVLSLSYGYFQRDGSANTAEQGGTLSTGVSVHSIDVGAKFFPAPRPWMFQPYGHVFGQVFVGQAEFNEGWYDDYSQSGTMGNLSSRTFDDIAPALGLGLGFELLSPRPNGRRIAFGGKAEAGVLIGPGGTQVGLAPGLDFGEAGTLEIGPVYLEAGFVAHL